MIKSIFSLLSCQLIISLLHVYHHSHDLLDVTPWGRDGGSLNQTSWGNGPLQPIRRVSKTLSVRNMALARKNGLSFARLAETLLGRYFPWHLSCFPKNINLLYFILAIWNIIVLFLQDVRKKAQAIQKQNTAPHVLSHGGYHYLEQKLLAEKTKKKLEEAA